MGLQGFTGLNRLFQWPLQRAIPALALVVALLLCALVAHDLSRDYDQQYATAAARTASLSQLMEEHARQSMRRIEQALTLVAQESLKQIPRSGAVSPALGTHLKSFLPQDHLIASFALLDLRGKILASTLTEDVSSLPSSSDRDFVLAHQGGASKGIFIGAAVQSRISGKWIIPVSVPLHGAFEGVLLGTIDPAYFQHLYQTIDVGGKGFVTLFNRQGWAIARWPFSADVAARNWLDSPLFKEHLPHRTEGTVRQKVVATGVDSLYSYRALSEYPLVVALGMPMDETLQPWRERRLYEGIGLFTLLAFLGASTVLMMGQLRRRIQAESALKLSEISVLKSTLPTLWIGRDARVLRVNRAACELHGYTEEQMLSMTVMDLNPRMLPENWPAHWERLRSAGSLRFESEHRKSDGVDIPIEAELNFIEFDGQEYNFAFIRDLSARKHNEEQIQRSAAMLRGAIDAVDEAFVLFDTEDRMVYCNEKYVKLYPAMQDVVVPGARFEDMIRAGAKRGLYRDSAGREEEWVAERLLAHREGHATRVQKLEDGRVMRVIDRRTPDGNTVGIRVDITEMVRATEEAQNASHYKSQFLANMSHEIRTPMNAILGLLSLLQKTDLTSVQRDYASKSESAAQSLLGLLNDILDFSKVEAGKMELDPQPFRLERMLADLGVILSSNIGGKSIEVLFDVDANVPAEVVADSMRLQQVLVNLAGNAIKFTSEGQVVVRVCGVAPTEPDAQPLVRFAIQDSGIGIAPDKQQHIFSGFSQAEASTTRRFGGTGLGLAICKRLVEKMGGVLTLQSTPGQGSTFSFEVPLPGAEPSGVDARPAPTNALNVLVVDDNPVAREILCRMASGWGWQVTGVGSGEEALAVVQATLVGGAARLDAIFLDWQMPGMDGWHTARQLRDLYAGATVLPRIVMLSANGRDTLDVRTGEEQALVHDLLLKPATPGALQDAALGRMSATARQRKGQASSKRTLAGMRVLVVEDNLINQQVAEELLNAEGALVSLAANGQLGVDAVQASQPPFDVVLMDIQMPVLDGYGATRKIRDELGLRALPIVAMTANAMASDRAACLEAGMNEHVGKPFDMRHLVSVLLRITGRAQPSEGGAADIGTPQAEPLESYVPAAVAEATSAYLDVDAALARIGGMTALYVDITREFVRSLGALEADFRATVERGDWPALAAQMHSLKGTSATLGATRLSEQAARMEKLFRKPTDDLLPLDHLPALLTLIRHTTQAAEVAIHLLNAPPEPQKVLDPSEIGPQQRQIAGAFLREMGRLLAESDLAVLELFSKRADTLSPLAPEHLHALHEALQSLDLDAAKKACEQAMASLSSRPS